MATIKGKANQNDTLQGGDENDKIKGLSGDDAMSGGNGNDTLIGGSGDDVMGGGTGADRFEWSAGHIGNGDLDIIRDFSLNQEDELKFRASGGGQEVEVLSATVVESDLEEANGVDLRNAAGENDIVLLIQNTVTGNIQQIYLLDVYSSSREDDWNDYLAQFGVSLEFAPEEEEMVELPMEEGPVYEVEIPNYVDLA